MKKSKNDTVTRLTIETPEKYYDAVEDRLLKCFLYIDSEFLRVMKVTRKGRCSVMPDFGSGYKEKDVVIFYDSRTIIFLAKNKRAKEKTSIKNEVFTRSGRLVHSGIHVFHGDNHLTDSITSIAKS